jgi:hydroxyacylglutathione hydrolase
VNLDGGIAPVLQPGETRLLDIDTFSESCAEKLVFDAREPEGFAGGHVAGSYSIWLGGLPVFGGWVGDARSPIYLITEGIDDIDTAAMHLGRIGIDNVQGGLGFGTWRKSGRPIEFSGAITPRELAGNRDRYQVLDVREDDEFAEGHIPKALHTFVGHLPERLDELALDRQRPVVVTCSVGHRAGLGVSMLLQAEFRDVRNLLGGMTAWSNLDLPMER